MMAMRKISTWVSFTFLYGYYAPLGDFAINFPFNITDYIHAHYKKNPLELGNITHKHFDGHHFLLS